MRAYWVVVLCLCMGPALSADITGKVYFKGTLDGSVRAGYVGRSSSGEDLHCFCGLSIGPRMSGASVECTTYRPRVSEMSYDGTMCTFRHSNLPPGRYMVYIRWDGNYYDWKLVTISSARASAQANLSINLSRAGNLELRLPGRSADYQIGMTPLTDKGKDPLPEADVPMWMDSEVDARSPRATIQGLREGLYMLDVKLMDKQVFRQPDGSQSHAATLTDYGVFTVRVRAGKCVAYQLGTR